MALIKSLGYNVWAGKNVLPKIQTFLTKKRYSSYFILCDENTFEHCLPLLIAACPQLGEAHIIETESGETSKCLEICTHIWKTLAENNADKETLFINLGGGVVSDLGGFCASTYKRGIDFLNIPTSLLAMADASIGGKTGIDFDSVKNIIGTFAQPVAVFVDFGFLHTLPERHLNNGMAEVYKMALVFNKKLWISLNNTAKPSDYGQYLLTSIECKNKIVLKDPYDKAQRKILNFGHTIGHAIESLCFDSPNALLHGEAIYIGMCIESHLAWQKKLLSKAQLLEIETVLKPRLIKELPPLEMEPLMQLMANDKKNSHSQLNFSLLNNIGSCVYNVKVNEKQLHKALDYYNSQTK